MNSQFTKLLLVFSLTGLELGLASCILPVEAKPKVSAETGAETSSAPDSSSKDIQEEKLNQWKRFSARGAEYFQSRNLQAAHQYFSRALRAIRGYEQGTDKEIATLARLADISLKENRTTEAENYYAGIVRLYGEKKNKQMEADAIDWLDGLSYSFLSYDKASGDYKADLAKRERFLLNALKLKEMALSNKNVVEILRALTVHYGSTKNYKEAEKYALILVKRDQRLNGFETELVAMELFNLANIKENLGKYAQAESYYRQSLAILLTREVSDPKVIPNIRTSLSRCLLKSGQTGLAEKEARTAFSDLMAIPGGAALYTVEARRVLAELALRQGRYKEAAVQEESIIKIIDRERGTNNPMYLDDMKTLVKVYKKMGRDKEARRVSEKAAYIETLMKK